jgi:hypothetical protein
MESTLVYLASHCRHRKIRHMAVSSAFLSHSQLPPLGKFAVVTCGAKSSTLQSRVKTEFFCTPFATQHHHVVLCHQRPFFFKLANFRRKEKLRIRNLKMKWFLRVSIAKSDGKKIIKSPDFYCWFSACSHEYRKLIKTFALHIWFVDRFGWILLRMIAFFGYMFQWMIAT